jgi:hypothetical protein
MGQHVLDRPLAHHPRHAHLGGGQPGQRPHQEIVLHPDQVQQAEFVHRDV